MRERITADFIRGMSEGVWLSELGVKSTDLRQRLDNQHARHHRLLRKMTRKKILAVRHTFIPNAEFKNLYPRDDLSDYANEALIRFGQSQCSDNTIRLTGGALKNISFLPHIAPCTKHSISRSFGIFARICAISSYLIQIL